MANLIFVGQFDELKYKLDLFGAFVTTDAQVARAHSYSLHIALMFNQIDVPVIELQHGMFQLGLHYYDVPLRNFCGDSLPSTSFAGCVVTYYPVEQIQGVEYHVIGYPPYSGNISSTADDNQVSVLTNLHWPTYTDKERHDFYEMVFQYAVSHPTKRIVWRQHSSEQVDPSCLRLKEALFEEFKSVSERVIFTQDDETLSKASVIVGIKFDPRRRNIDVPKFETL